MDFCRLLLKYLPVLDKLLGILGLIQDNTQKSAQENRPFEIATNVAISVSVLDWSDSSPGPLRLKLEALENQIGTLGDDLSALIANLQLAADPVILPTTPPTGYGGGATVDDVWGFELTPDGIIAADALEIAGHLALVTQSSGQLPVQGNPYMVLEGAIASEGYYFPGSSSRPLNPMNILADDTRLSWIEREATGRTWIHDASQDNYYFQDAPPSNDLLWRCIVDQEWFNRLKATSVGVVPGALVLPPLWPGLDAVTLGTPVDLDAGVTISEPMDGVIIDVTSVPPKQGWFTFDGLLSYRNLGALTFLDDNDQAELAQPLGFTSAVYCPKTMAHAASVKLRTSVDVTGTVTPWIVTPA